MRKTTFILSIVVSIVLFIGCEAKTQSNRAYFLKNEERVIIVPVKISDSITANMLFDTGAAFNHLKFDSTFCTDNLLPVWNDEPIGTVYSYLTGWETSVKRPYTRYETPVNINIGNKIIQFNGFWMQDTKKDFSVDVDGLFGFPKDHATQIWELNFEHGYMEIHQSDNFKMPDNCYQSPMIHGQTFPIYVQFPITIKCADGDTVTLNYPYLIDAGLTQEFVLMSSAKELEFFNKRDDAILFQKNTGRGVGRSRYEVSAKLFGDFEINSMRIYTDTVSDLLKEDAIIGMNFLKRFNVFFDFNKKTVGFQPIKNYKRIIDPNVRRFYFSSNITVDGREFVGEIMELKNNPYQDAGLKSGDEIVAINGYEIKSMTPDNAAKIRGNQIKVLEIMRDGEPLKLTVHLDENEVKGE